MSTRADAVVVLGGPFGPSGGMSANTKARMDTAIDLMRKKISPRLIVTGNHSWIEPKRKLPIAQLMANYATEKKMPGKILVEDQSRDTIGNADLVKEKFTEPNNWKSLVVITNEFHLNRSKRVFEQVMGRGYRINMVSAPNFNVSFYKIYEIVAELLTRLALASRK